MLAMDFCFHVLSCESDIFFIREDLLYFVLTCFSPPPPSCASSPSHYTTFFTAGSGEGPEGVAVSPGRGHGLPAVSQPVPPCRQGQRRLAAAACPPDGVTAWTAHAHALPRRAVLPQCASWCVPRWARHLGLPGRWECFGQSARSDSGDYIYICRGARWGVREAGWKHEWRVTSQRLL